VAVWAALLFHTVEGPDSGFDSETVILTEVRPVFPQSLQEDCGIVPQIMPLPIPSESIPVYYWSLIILTSDAIYSELLNALLNDK
jgi:hypothetical protein